MNRVFNQSEVARLLTQIEEEYLAATQGLTGLAVTAKHRAITARSENMTGLHRNLCALLEDDVAKLVAERLDHLPSESTE